MEFNVNTDEAVVFTNKLEKLNRSAFPNAVRGTLNGLAFDVKKNTMPTSAEKEFVNRRKNFFKASSRVSMARGFDINSMESKVGFIPFNGSSRAVEDLEQQEHGGRIKKRSFVATDKARISGSRKRSVRTQNRLGRIKNIVKTSSVQGSSEGQKVIVAATKAGIGGHVLTKSMLFKVKKLTRSKGKIRFKLEPIYSFKKGRSVKVDATHFMKKASEKSARKGNDIYCLLYTSPSPRD